MTRLPEHLRGRKNPRMWVLRRFANAQRGLYGQPVYLCGSALLDGNAHPRDWDIRIVLPDDQFALRYGNGRNAEYVVGRWVGEALDGAWTAIRWRWSDDCVKHSLQGCRDTGLNIDFQVYPASHAKALYKSKPKIRLDTRARGA